MQHHTLCFVQTKLTHLYINQALGIGRLLWFWSWRFVEMWMPYSRRLPRRGHTNMCKSRPEKLVSSGMPERLSGLWILYGNWRLQGYLWFINGCGKVMHTISRLNEFHCWHGLVVVVTSPWRLRQHILIRIQKWGTCCVWPPYWPVWTYRISTHSKPYVSSSLFILGTHSSFSLATAASNIS